MNEFSDPPRRRSIVIIRRTVFCLVLSVVLLAGLYLLTIAESCSAPWCHFVTILGHFFAEVVFVAVLVERVLSLVRHEEERRAMADQRAQLLDGLDERRNKALRGIETSIDRRSLAIQGTLQDRADSLELLTRRCASQGVKINAQEFAALQKRIDTILADAGLLRQQQANTIERIEDSQEEFLQQLECVRRDLTEEIRLAQCLRQAGIVNLVHQMDIAALFQRLSRGDTLYFKDTFAPNYREWLGPLKDAVRRGIHVKMFAIKPGCKVARDRARQIRPCFPNFMQQLREFIKAMADTHRELALENAGGSFEVRLYSEPANYPLYLVVDSKGFAMDGFVSFFADQPTAYGVPHFEVRQPMLSSFFNDVSEMWKRSTSLAT